MLRTFLPFGLLAFLLWFSEYQGLSYIIIFFMVLKLIDILDRRRTGPRHITIKRDKTETGN
jgi:hypothetical protein